MGIDEKTFYAKREQFLIENPKINGIQIDIMDGSFYKGKLYYITIQSKMRSESKPDITRTYTQTELDRIYNADYVWSSIYKKKYPNAKYVKYGDYNTYLLLKKGKCTIKVYDRTLPASSFEELEEQIRNWKKYKNKYCSSIQIYDENVIKQIEQDNQKQKNKEANESMDII